MFKVEKFSCLLLLLCHLLPDFATASDGKIVQSKDFLNLNKKINATNNDVISPRFCPYNCKDGHPNCCSATETIVDNQPYCETLISKQSLEVSSSAAATLDCIPYDNCELSSCEWLLPNNVKCFFSASNPIGTVCSNENSVRLQGNIKDGDCSIIVSEATVERHNGRWGCHAVTTTGYFDYINITVNDGFGNDPVNLSAGQIVAITVPIGLLLIGVIITLLFCCFCRERCSCCIPDRPSKRIEKSHRDTQTKSQESIYCTPNQTDHFHHQDPLPAIPTMGPIDQHSQRVYHNDGSFTSSHVSHTVNVSDYDELSDSSSDRKRHRPPLKLPTQRRQGFLQNPAFVPEIVVEEPVEYTQAGIEQGHLKPKTARKISNTTSLHSFQQPKPPIKKFSVL